MNTEGSREGRVTESNQHEEEGHQEHQEQHHDHHNRNSVTQI
jgi:hypothetical protein